MWSDDRNCDVSADFPTSEAPSIATRNTFITGDSSGLATSPPFLLDFLGRYELFLEFTRDGLRDDAPEHCPETSSSVLVLVWILPFEGMELFRLWTTLEKNIIAIRMNLNHFRCQDMNILFEIFNCILSKDKYLFE